ncbi:MAG: DUF1614 domain-containing protein [Thermoplasmatota archaeon]
MWSQLLQALFLLLLPLVLLAGLLAAYVTRRGMFHAIGFSRQEMGLIAIGPFAAMLFDVPVFIYQDYFLAFNIGGAIVPIALSLHLIRKHAISLPRLAIGTGLVAVASFMITRVTDMGVVASFPFYLLPSILAALLALLLISRQSTAAPGYGYAIATLGVVIGADFFHLPEIFSEPFMGSVGGAGLYDMVYIAGLLSMGLILPFMSRSIKRRPYQSTDPHFLLRKARRTPDREMARHVVVRAVRQKLLRLGYPGDGETLRRLLGPAAGHDFRVLQRRSFSTAEDARAAWTTGSLLIDALDKLERQRYASALRRTLAFFIDAAILGFLSLLPALLSGFNRLTMFFVFFFSLQLIYFTGLEYLAGTTVGKGLLRLAVTDERGGYPNFMTVFTRNIIRFFDMLLLGYLVSLIMIGFTEKKQRLGDIVAGTVVVKNR